MKQDILDILYHEYGYKLVNDSENITEFYDEVNGVKIYYSASQGIGVVGKHCIIDHNVISLINQYKAILKDNVVIINGTIKLAQELNFKSGNRLLKYFVSYGKGSVNVNYWSKEPLLEQGTKIGILGYLQENTYKDSQGAFKSAGNEVTAYQIATAHDFELDLNSVFTSQR